MRNQKSGPWAMACIAIGVVTLTLIQQASAADPKPSAAQPQPSEQQRDQQADQQNIQQSEQRQRERSAQQTKFQLDRAAKDILNKEVRNRQDEKLGKVEELAFDAERDVIAYAILDVGGFLGIGGKHVAVPFQALNLERKQGDRDMRIVVDMDKDRLKNAPGAFDKDSWPDMTNAQLARDIHRHYGAQPYWEMERERIARGERERDLKGEPISPQPQPGEQPTEAQQRQRDRARADMHGKKILKMEADLLNRDLKNQAKEDIGDVKDFLVDDNTGHIAFVVVELDEKSNVLQEDKSKRLAALPFQLVEFRKEEGDKGAFILSTNVDRVRGQLFSNEQWPKLTEREWAATVYRHYDVQPYWETVIITREQRGGQREDQQQREQQQNQQNNPQQ